MFAMSVFQLHSPALWQRTPGFLSTSRIFPSSYTMSSRGTAILRQAFSSRGASKNSSGRYMRTVSPSARRASPFAGRPLILISFLRSVFCRSDSGISGAALLTNRSSRCPASFRPMVNSFIIPPKASASGPCPAARGAGKTPSRTPTRPPRSGNTTIHCPRCRSATGDTPPG